MMRLGLLLGDRLASTERLHGSPLHGGAAPPLPPGTANQTEAMYTGFRHHPSSLPLHMANQTDQTFTSVSSLSSSNDNTPEKGLSDTSPMSTLTGEGVLGDWTTYTMIVKDNCMG